jgi:nucleoside-diphosphate-sugar epimerase
VYNDWSGVDELTNLPDEAFHRSVDKIVLEAGTKNGDMVKTALLCPPTIYGELVETSSYVPANQIIGKGRGIFNTRSRQAYELAKVVLTEKCIPIIGAGKARWCQVHVADLANAFSLLVDAAVSKKLDDELWGAKGYYLIENGEFYWSDLAKSMGKKAAELGYIPDPEVKPLSKDAALDIAGFEAVSWGLNSRAKGERARKVLGWKPTRPRLEDEVPDILKQEHDRLSSK